MFSKHETDKKNIFVNTIKVDKKKESKTTPHVSIKMNAYDRVVQIVTNDNNEIKPEEEATKQAHMIMLMIILFFAYFASNVLTRSCNSLFAFTKYAINPM